MTPAYYNEFDPFAAEWLRNLIAVGLIPAGDVDERSICDVSPDDLRGYGQAHFFAGIGGWPLALRMAGVPDDAPVWTGSCPCQPFSAAGKQKGKEDERHLWPVFRRLIGLLRPEYAFGEQVASAIAHGWIDDLQADLEAEDYAVGYAVLGAHSVGTPHIRQRLYWGGRLADADIERRGRLNPLLQRRGQDENSSETPRRGETGGVADADRGQRHGQPSGEGRIGDRQAPGREQGDGQFERGGEAGFWSRAEPWPCRDGKYRLIEPGVFPLAYGVSGRVGKLRAYGNAIVPQVGAAFVKAFMECVQ